MTGSSLAHSQLRLDFAHQEPSSLGVMWKPSSPAQVGGSAGDTDIRQTERHQRAYASPSSAIPEPAELHHCYVPFLATALEGENHVGEKMCQRKLEPRTL